MSNSQPDGEPVGTQMIPRLSIYGTQQRGGTEACIGCLTMKDQENGVVSSFRHIGMD